jgi:exopolysaccharide biosynthesis polyprenyl glycosylphosphotransferase
MTRATSIIKKLDTEKEFIEEDISQNELTDQLYNRYAFGGTEFSKTRLKISHFFKISLWRSVIWSSFLLKRTLDIVVSLFFLILLSPIYLITAIVIKLESPGPVFFSQNRVGKWGRIFKMYKFRSMRTDAEKLKNELLSENETGGIIFKMKNDPRITAVGKFIRKFSIDELPQLWNVLKGDMSLVGPRPPVPEEVSQYNLSNRKRLNITPGITCIWQISGRSLINFEGQVRLDIQYIQNQSFWGDIKILIKTIPAVLFGRGAC